MNEKAAGLLARLGFCHEERQPDTKGAFQVDRGGAYGQIKVRVVGDDGQMVSLERQKAGGEVRVEYYPGLVGLYGHDGTLRRIYCRFLQYLVGLRPEMKEGLPLDIVELIGYLGRRKSELVLYTDINGGFIRMMYEVPNKTWRVGSIDLEAAMGDLCEVDLPLGEGRPPVGINFILSHEDDLYYLGVGADRVVVGSPVRESIDMELLKGEVTEDVARRVLTAGKQIKASFV